MATKHVAAHSPEGDSAWDRVVDRRAELDRVRDALAAVTAEAATPERSIVVTVNSRGLLIDLVIEPAALRRYSSSSLAEVITGLVASADDRLRQTRNQVLAACVQSDDAEYRSVLDREGM